MTKFTLWDKEVDLDYTDAESFLSADEMKDIEQHLPNCQHEWMKSVSGHWLHCRKFLPYTKPKAVLVYCHGVQTHSGTGLVVKDRKLSMTLLVQHYVQEQGFALYAIDHVGHGYSEGTRALIRDYRHNRDDLHNYCEQVSKQNPDLPLFLMGYSYGATLVLQVAAKYKDQPKLAGIILLASFLRGDIPNFVKIFVLRYLLTPLMPTSSPFFMPRPMTSERLWRDEDVLRINTSQARRKIDVCGKPYRLLTAVQLLEASHEVLNESIPSLQAPFVALHGTQDDGCPVRDLDYLRNNPCGSIVLLEGAHHDLLADPAAEETLEHADAFIQKRLEQVKREM